MTMEPNGSMSATQPGSSGRFRQCRRYATGSAVAFVGATLVFVGIPLIGLPLAGVGLGMCKKAIQQARAAAPPGSPAANAIGQGAPNRLWQLVLAIPVIALLGLFYLILERPTYSASHAWVGRDYLALLVTVLAISVVKAIVTGRKVFFVEYGRIGPSVAESGAGQDFRQMLRADTFMKRAHWTSYAAWALIAVLFLLLFALPKDSPIALWLIYGIVAVFCVYVLLELSRMVRTFTLALCAKRQRDRAG